MRNTTKTAVTFDPELGDLNEFIGHELKNVEPYFTAQGFKELPCAFKYKRVYNDYAKNRCILVDLYDSNASLEGRVQYVLLCNTLYKRWSNAQPAKAIFTPR